MINPSHNHTQKYFKNNLSDLWSKENMHTTGSTWGWDLVGTKMSLIQRSCHMEFTLLLLLGKGTSFSYHPTLFLGTHTLGNLPYFYLCLSLEKHHLFPPKVEGTSVCKGLQENGKCFKARKQNQTLFYSKIDKPVSLRGNAKTSET